MIRFRPQPDSTPQRLKVTVRCAVVCGLPAKGQEDHFPVVDVIFASRKSHVKTITNIKIDY